MGHARSLIVIQESGLSVYVNLLAVATELADSPLAATAMARSFIIKSKAFRNHKVWSRFHFFICETNVFAYYSQHKEQDSE